MKKISMIALGLLSVLLYCTPVFSQTTVTPKHLLLDNYAGTDTDTSPWYYSRIGTDRGAMGGGVYDVNMGEGRAVVTVQNGWAGVWTNLIHNAESDAVLKADQLLGPYVRSEFQPRINGIEVSVVDGQGKFKVELKDIDNKNIFVQSVPLNGGAQTINLPVNVDSELKAFNWLIDGPGGNS